MVYSRVHMYDDLAISVFHFHFPFPVSISTVSNYPNINYLPYLGDVIWLDIRDGKY